MTGNDKPTVNKNKMGEGVQDLSGKTILTGTLSAAPKLESGYLTASRENKK